MGKMYESYQACGNIPDARDLLKRHSSGAFILDQQRKTNGIPSGPEEDVVFSFIKADFSC